MAESIRVLQGKSDVTALAAFLAVHEDEAPLSDLGQWLIRDHTIVLLFADRTLVGYGVLIDQDEWEAKGMPAVLDSLFILPEYRGRGHGKAMIERLLAENLDREIVLYAESDNEPLLKLYQTYGFTVLCRAPHRMFLGEDISLLRRPAY